MRGVLEHYGGRIEVGSNVIEAVGEIYGAGTENALRAGDLSVQNFVAHARSVSVRGAEWAANTGQQNFGAGAARRLHACLRFLRYCTRPGPPWGFHPCLICEGT